MLELELELVLEYVPHRAVRGLPEAERSRLGVVVRERQRDDLGRRAARAREACQRGVSEESSELWRVAQTLKRVVALVDPEQG